MAYCLAFLLLAQAVSSDVEDALGKEACDAAFHALQYRGAKLAAESVEFNREAKLRSRFKSMLDTLAQRYNTSFQVGYRDHDISIELAAGVENHVTGKKISTSSIIPLGSATKTWTATAVIQLVEQGRIKMDDPLHQHVDPILRRLHNTTMLVLWQDPRIEQATVKHALSMQAGLSDYDDGEVFAWTVQHPDGDYTPIMYLESANKTLQCDPGSCTFYSGIGYVLLGYLLAEKLSVDGTWEGYNQMSVIPEQLRPEFSRTRFGIHGKCKEISGHVVHQFRDNWWPLHGKDGLNISDELSGRQMVALDWTDLLDFSCLNGWTMGNIITPAIEQANFLYYLLVAQKLISPANIRLMTDGKFVTKGWGAGRLKYGLGLELDSVQTMHRGEIFPLKQHGGLDWGSRVLANLADEQLGFSLVLSTNSFTGMNCSLPNVNDNDNGFFGDKFGLCNALDLVLAVYEEEGKSSVRLNCTAYADADSEAVQGKCVHGLFINPTPFT
eukprot:TRINITY_DN6743_c0_g1_i1.p1 TRINITY_DN6743_c0_g1~~TRINITY_DN6743_c0_g1_i1.p1  ORF type:complete len:497 (-),score=69.75 TRINITY_DN6743_c0_g1_i1:169-1659(-)